MRSTTRMGGSASPNTFCVNARPRAETTFPCEPSRARSSASWRSAPGAPRRMRSSLTVSMMTFGSMPFALKVGGRSDSEEGIDRRSWDQRGNTRAELHDSLGLFGRGGRRAVRGREVLDQTDFVARLVVRQLVHEIARQHDAKAAFAQSERFPDHHVADRVFGLCCVRQALRVEARSTVTDRDRDLFWVA